MAAAIVVVAFASVLLVIGSVSYASGWGLQGLFHRTGWVYLMYGANYAAGGMHNVEDADLIMEGRPSFAEMNRRARELALERISADVPRLTQFAFTEKMRGLYGRDPKLFRRAHGGSDQGEMLEAHVQPAVERVKDGAYRLAFLLFLALLAREVWRPGRLLVLGFIVLLYSLPHLLLEVDQRMHQVMLPYIIAGAALLFYELAPAAGRKPWMRPERFTQRAF